jgi:hypothetical protein
MNWSMSFIAVIRSRRLATLVRLCVIDSPPCARSRQ